MGIEKEGKGWGIEVEEKMSPVRYKDVQRDKLREIILSPSEETSVRQYGRKENPKANIMVKEKKK